MQLSQETPLPDILEVEQYGTLISQFCKNDLSAQKVRKN